MNPGFTEAELAARIVEGDLTDLLALRESATHGNQGRSRRYLDILIAFKTADIPALEALARETDPDPVLRCLLELRILLARREWNEATLARAEALKADSPAWEAERAYLIAAACFDHEAYARSLPYFAAAARDFKAAGAPRAALSCEYSELTARSWIHPEANLLRDHLALYRRARRLDDRVVATTALLNLSRELQKLGALRSALRLSERGLSLLRARRGGLTYFRLHLQSGHLLWELGRGDEARVRLEICLLCDSLEIRSAVRILENALGGQASPNSEGDELAASWKERLRRRELEGSSRAPLGALEEHLLRSLAEAARTPDELQVSLFGSALDPLAARIRLKSTLERLRRKHPGLIRFEEGRYSLSGAELDRTGSVF